LAVAVGVRKRLARSDIPTVAWNMNLGDLHSDVRRQLAQFALGRVNRFVVHSRSEVHSYSEWLQMEPGRFAFVPLQRATRPITIEEDKREPFVLSMGSAQRDYRLLFAVLAELRYPTIVVAGQHAVEALTVPSNVTVRSSLTLHECHELLQRARLNVIPIANQVTASGQVTLLDAMVFGRPTIVTHCPASVDYVRNGYDALLVRAGDHDHLKKAISLLWNDDKLREEIGRSARKTAIEQFSDEAVGAVMGRLLREVALER
jgi:glycosyltransferase involved in cell wall biosynthesis